MMSAFKNKIAYKRMQSVTFSSYSSAELRHLSVKEVTNLRSFDELGHATTGGLYDPVFGKCEAGFLPGSPVFLPPLKNNIYHLRRCSMVSLCHLLAGCSAPLLALKIGLTML